MPKTFLVRKFLHQQQLLEEQAQQRQSSVITSVDSSGKCTELGIDLSPKALALCTLTDDRAKDQRCHQETETVVRNTVISSLCSDHEDDQPLSLTVHDRNGKFHSLHNSLFIMPSMKRNIPHIFFSP